MLCLWTECSCCSLFQNKMSCLWMGNLEPYMDEKFISRAFATLGELVVGVRIIRNKAHWGASGYCFVELADEATAERCLRKANGKPLPGASPPRRFKLNRATYGRQGENRDDYFDNPYHQQYSYSADQYYQEWANYCLKWGYDQNTGAYSSCSYEQYDYGNQPYKEDEDHSLEEPSVELDIEEANRLFIEESEELYEALIDCHWPVLGPPT